MNKKIISPKRSDQSNLNSKQLFTGKEQCCGCSACANVCGISAIQMKADSEGFLYPIINRDRCIQCFLCISVCPLKI